MIEVSVKYNGGMKVTGINTMNHETQFDSHPDGGGENSAPTPMEVMLESLAACTYMDVISIIRKKRRTVNDLVVHAQGERAEKHPKVYTKVHLIYELHSQDAEASDLERAVQLSESTYCSAIGLFKKAGVEITHESKIIK
jgi:putative redox protein